MTEDKNRLETDGGEYPTQWKRPSVFYNEFVKWIVYLFIAAFIVWSIWEVRIGWERFVYGMGQAQELLASMWPPDYAPDSRVRILDGMIESIGMAILASIVGIGISIPIAFMGARNLVPAPVYYVGRSIIMVSRALHELVLAIIAVVAVGFGPLAGIIALIWATPGFYSKLLAEDLEDIDEGQVEAVRATGASSIQIWWHGVIPQVMPRIIGLAVYRWDINIRASTIVGIVGAGGIGITLIQAFDRYEYDFVLAIVLAIIVIVMLGEGISAWTRKKVQ